MSTCHPTRPSLRAGVVEAVAGALTDGKEPVRKQAYATLDLLRENSCDGDVLDSLRSTLPANKFKRIEKTIEERARQQ